MLQIFAGWLGGRSGNEGRQAAARTGRHRIQPRLEGLECRDLKTGTVAMTAGSAVAIQLTGGDNTATVSYQTHNGALAVDVNLNGQDNFFAPSTVGMITFDASSTSGNETFTNNTGIETFAKGGAGTNTLNAGSGLGVYVGGSGTNNFNSGTGFNEFVAGTGTNTFNLSSGSGMVFKDSGSDAVVNSDGQYQVF